MRKRNILAAAGACLAALGLMAPMAIADPAPPTNRLLAGSGSDTTQDIMNLMTGVIPTLASWDVPPAAPDPYTSKTPITGSPCSLARVTGSNAGVQQLITERDAAVAGNRRPCLDYARSSANNSGSFGTGNDLTWVPFAKDGITMVVRKNWAFSTNFSVALLRNLYTCTDARTQGANPQIKPLLPQPGSGTRSTFLAFIGNPTLGACVSDDDPSAPGQKLPENFASKLTQQSMLVPHSIGQYTCQQGGACTDNTGLTLMARIAGVLPDLDNPAFPFLRVLFNVIPTAHATQPDATGTAAGTDPSYGSVFVGNNSSICQNSGLLRSRGFAPLGKPDPLLPINNTGCGDVISITGGGPTRNVPNPTT